MVSEYRKERRKRERKKKGGIYEGKVREKRNTMERR